MVHRIGCLLLTLLSSSVFSESGLIGNNGLFGSLGAGFAPIYIEEVTTNQILSSGATVTALHSSLQVGGVVGNNYAVALLADHNWYIDSDRNLYMAGLTGLGFTYLVPDFHQFYLSTGAGLATKMVFGTQNSATGWGFLLGVGRPINDQFALDISYEFLNLSSSTQSSGDAEAISSLQLTIAYRWY